MLNIKNLILGAVASAIVGAIGAWWITSDLLTARHNAIVQAMKVQAAQDLQAATIRAIEAERRNTEIATKLETDHAKTRQALDSVLADNRRLSRELGGLRDPFAKSSGSCPLPAPSDGTRVVTEPAPAGRLSNEASEFLLEFAREADRAAEYANTCHRWIEEVNGRR